MDLQQASGRLAQLREGGTLAEVREVVEEARPAFGDATPQEVAAFMLTACDVLGSYDLGDYEEQPRMLHSLAEEALSLPGLDVRQQLRFLAHLEDHRPTSRPDWPQLREQRSRAWLALFKRMQQLAGPAPDPANPPLLTVPLPDGVNLPYGVAPEAIENEQARSQYEEAIERNRQYSEQVARHHEMDRLRKEYEAHATAYITRAFSEPPHDLQSLRRVFNDVGEAPGATDASGVPS